jgi:hypothetical protein
MDDQGVVYITMFQAPSFSLSNDLDELRKRRDELCLKIERGNSPLAAAELQLVVQKHANVYFEQRNQRNVTKVQEEDELEQWRKEDDDWLADLK